MNEHGALDQKIANLLLAIATLVFYMILLVAFHMTSLVKVYGFDCDSAGCKVPG